MQILFQRHQTQRRATALSRRDARKRRAVRRLLAESLERRMLLTTITSVDPAANSHAAATSTDISATFDQDVVAATVTPQNFVVHGTLSGGQLLAGDTTVSATGPVVTSDPTNDFAAGEVVQVTATGGISTTGGAANKRVWQFRTASGGTGQFADGGLVLGQQDSFQHAALGDIDADGDLDVIHGGSQIWLNDGNGGFTDSGRNLGGSLGENGLEFADVDADGDLDLIEGTRLMLNDGNGVFSNSGTNLGGGLAKAGDVDGDGDLDIMTGVRYAPNRLWLNNGSGQFSDSGQALGNGSTDGINFGDFDGDGDLDVFETINGTANKIWINDGSGGFTETQTIGGFRATKDADVGDIDGDGDLDVISGNVYNNIGGRVYLNDGGGVFVESGQVIGGGTGQLYRVRLGDVDGDQDLDFIAFQRFGAGTEIWLNDGSGGFADSGQRLVFAGGARRIDGADIGDIDGDGDLDLLEVNTRQDGAGSRIWFNQNPVNPSPDVSLAIDNATIDEAAGMATITATLSATHTEAVTIDLAISGTATATDDYTTSGTQIVVAVGATTGSVTVTAVQDTVDEPDETVIVDITAVTNGQEAGTLQVTTTIIDDDEPVAPDVTLSVDNAEIAEAAGVATFAVTLSEITTVPVTVELGITGTAAASDFTASGTQLVIAPGDTTGSISITAVDDAEDESNETVTVDITAVTGGNETGEQQQTTTITDDDDPPKLTVTALTPSTSGFTAEFSTDLNTSVLNLYDTQTAGLGPADVVLQGAASGPIAGSLVVDPSLRSVTFIKSGGPLSADTYTVTLRSAADGFVDGGGQLLDGNDDGTEGDDYSGTFEVAEPAANSVTIGIPDIVRGPGQELNLPADATGIPVTISEGTNVRAVDLRVAYDPTLLTITGGSVGADAPAGSSVIVNTSAPGLAIVVFFSTNPLPAGSGTFVNLEASVPATDPSGIYGSQQVLDVHGVIVSDGNDNEAPTVVDDAVQLASFFADVSGNGRINAADASGVARNAALIDNGFGGAPNTDPLVMGDISGNGRLNAADASLLAQSAALIPVDQIPPIPGGVVITGEDIDSGPGQPGVPTLLLNPSPTDYDSTGSSGGVAPLATPTPVPHPALDLVMASLGDRSLEDREEELLLALESAIEELLKMP